MSISFDGSGHQYVGLSAGTIGAAGTGDYTIVALMRPQNYRASPVSLWSGSLTGTDVREIILDGVGGPGSGKWFGAGDFSAGFSTGIENTWYLIGQSKAAGTNVYHWHRWVYNSSGDISGGNAPTHADGTGTHGDGSTIAAVRLGDGANENWGEIAVVAVWKRVLSDADFTSLCTTTASSFMSLGTGAADALWLCNVSSPASIVDSTNNGANETTVVGSGITGSAADPPSYSYNLWTSVSNAPLQWLQGIPSP